MPRPKKPGSGEPKTRSRHGCWPCKHRKIKCGEEKPHCMNCQRNGETCDYSIVLNWQGRNKKGGSPGNNMLGTSSFSTVQYNSDGQKRKTPVPSGSPPNLTQQMSFDNDSQIYPKRDFDGAFNDYTDPSGAALGITGFSPPQQRPAGIATTKNIDPSLSRIRALNAESYPSPAETNVGSPPGSAFPLAANTMIHNAVLPDPMPPPIPGLPYQPLPPLLNTNGHSRQTSNEDQGFKRVRLSPATENFDAHYQPQPESTPSYFSTPNYASRPKPHNLAPSNPYSPSSLVSRVPPTPAASIGSDDNHTSQAKPSPHRIDSPNNRRVSIQSLVSGNSPLASPYDGSMQCRVNDNSSHVSGKRTYGFDCGVPDIDLPENKDHDALSPYTPKKRDSTDDTSPGMEFNLDECYSQFGFTLDAPAEIQQPIQQEEVRSYYTRPVKVEITVAFGPLPPELLNNPMNLLYFHHFVNHTARILVPYDCAENPFKTLLPKMALQDSTLLHLLLAYSAKHRARLLHHAEPANRIAEWMQDVLIALIAAIGKPAHEISDSNLATAIMLASLEIISPAPETDEIKISWQKHLEVARKMMLARSESGLVAQGGEINLFLTRWFAYLDVLGSLSGSGQKPLFHGNYFQDEDEDSLHSYQIDCLMGFTSRCVSILARVAELAHQCDNERQDPQGNVIPNWKPSDQTIEEAEAIKRDLHKARQHVQQGCHHRRNSATDNSDPSYAVELVTTNDAFHWAGLIQLDRRVLGKASTDPEVQFYVREIVAALTKIRPGGTAEACLLFPMFTAGCDAFSSDRAPIMERLKSVERSGMFQVRQAISLVEKVWETGRSWETFIGEVQFIG